MSAFLDFKGANEGLSVDGYTAIFKKMLAYLQIDIKKNIPAGKLVVFTGPIDRY